MADGPWAATKHVDLDDSTGDYLQAMLFDGAGGTCLEADRDIGRALVRGAHAEMNIQLTP